MTDEARKANYPGTVRTKLVAEEFQLRVYFFDPKSNEGLTYYIPQINGTNSQFLPGFLADNAAAKYPSIYFNGILKLWNSPNAQTLESWEAAHPAVP